LWRPVKLVDGTAEVIRQPAPPGHHFAHDLQLLSNKGDGREEFVAKLVDAPLQLLDDVGLVGVAGYLHSR
jgi:hypothetical protein